MIDIVEEIGMPAMLGQLAEECAELGKAALKLQRILMGKNPTPVTEQEARKSILEEATDVTSCLCLLTSAGYKTLDMDQYHEKLDRWRGRIEAAKMEEEQSDGETR